MFKLHTIGNIKINLFMKREMLKTVMGRAIYMAFAVFAVFAMASCSDDDGNNGDGGDDTSGGGSDGTEMESPRFESSAAKYTITDAGSPYTSVELTASGNYIIFTSGSQAHATAAAAPATRMSVMSDGAGRPDTRYIILTYCLANTPRRARANTSSRASASSWCRARATSRTAST